MTSHRVTIKDVAKAAGVSAMTVTRAFRNDLSIAAETREKVMTAAAALNYHPNSSARALRGSATGSIGIIASNTGYIGQSMHYISLNFMQLEYMTSLIDSLGDKKFVRFALAETITRSMDAMIFEYRSTYGDLNKLLINQKNPIVFSKHQYENCHADFCFIDIAGAYSDAITHLLQSGKKHIYNLNTANYHYPEVFHKHGIENGLLNTTLYPSQPGYENHVKAFIDFFETGNKIDAVFCGNTLVASKICAYLKRKKIRIPEEISVISFDYFNPEYYYPPDISTISVNTRELGTVLTGMTMFRLKNPAAPFQKRTVKPEFIQ